MTTATHKYQAPKGTRDLYPADIALRRHIESVWRDVSINHGFEEIDGPTFEHLELYTTKSGPGIVSELFSFRRAGGETDYALRPEFTPTLARMYAARAKQLPKPTKWFSIGPMFRAERPQRGRLREHVQWNVDVIGDESVEADADVIATCVAVFRRLGLDESQVRLRISDRRLVQEAFEAFGHGCSLDQAFDLLDKRPKLDAGSFDTEAARIGFDLTDFDRRLTDISNATIQSERGREREPSPVTDRFFDLLDALADRGVRDWCVPDPGIVRGLAYYTGTVFEVHEASGKERAIAGGGRYDGLVDLFGGPSTPAVGIAMGDVVIRLVLEDLGLLEAADAYLPRPDVFVISSGTERAEGALRPLVAQLRRSGLHARHSHRATRNVGKLLGEAGKTRARFALILGEELNDGRVVLKDLDAQEQAELPMEPLDAIVGHVLAGRERSRT